MPFGTTCRGGTHGQGRRVIEDPELTVQRGNDEAGPITIGIDLGDRFSHCCVLGPNGECLAEGRIRTAPDALARHFQDLPRARIAIEVGAPLAVGEPALDRLGT